MLLSLSAAVVVVGLIVPTLIFPARVYSIILVVNVETTSGFFSLTVVLSLVVIAVVALRWKQWRSFAVAAVVGQAAGAGLLSVTVWAVSPLFLSYFKCHVGTLLLICSSTICLDFRH